MPEIGYVKSSLTRYMTKPTPKLGAFAEQRSTSCLYIMCNNALVHWRSKVASVLATSTTEAELISDASCAQGVAFCRRLANELGFVQAKPTILWEGNTGFLSLAKSGHYRGRSKHFSLRFQFISDHVDQGILELRHIPTKDFWGPYSNQRFLPVCESV